MNNFKNFFNHVYQLLVWRQEENAFDFVLNSNSFFLEEDILNFFTQENKGICISGSGGSGIKKPNLTTLLAFHISRILKNTSEIRPIYKTGSSKRTSLQGSTEFANLLLNKDFIYKDDTIFFKTINLVCLLKCVRNVIEDIYIKSVPFEKK